MSLKSAQAFLRDEGSSQVARQWKKPSAASGVYAPTGAPPGHFQADVTFVEDYAGVNDKRKAIMTVLNTTTRLAAARPLLSNKSAKTAEAMESIIQELGSGVVKLLRVDGGPDFKKEFAIMMKSRGIDLEVGEAHTHYRLARTDRFHRTLRERLGEHFERANTHRWIDVLPEIVANYNETPHSTLTKILGRPTAPSQVTPSDERLIRQAENRQASTARAITDKLDIVPNTRVRLLVAKTKEGGQDAHAKSQRRVWTSEAFTVLARNGPNSFTIDVPAGEVKIWPSYALQVVVGEPQPTAPQELLPSGSKVNVKVVRAKRLEARNISEGEQAAALAAPARPRSARAARVDYAALAGGKPRSAPVPARRSARLAVGALTPTPL